MHIHDLHVTILDLMGFDHERLMYRYADRDFRLTDVHGRVIRDIIALKLRELFYESFYLVVRGSLS